VQVLARVDGDALWREGSSAACATPARHASAMAANIVSLGIDPSLDTTKQSTSRPAHIYSIRSPRKRLSTVDPFAATRQTTMIVLSWGGGH
jgi:hypothetical protein